MQYHEPTYAELGYSNPVAGWFGENVVRFLIEDDRLVQQGGLGDDILLTAMVVTEGTSLVDPTPVSDLANATVLIIDGRNGEALIVVGAAGIPGGLDKALRKMPNIHPGKLADLLHLPNDEMAETALRRGRRPGRPGNPDHVADVARNNDQLTGELRPRQVGNRVPDGVGNEGQIVTIRNEVIDPGPDSRVIVESERFLESGQIVGDGRRQIRDIRAADQNATIVVTDPANTVAPPLIYLPGQQPPPGYRLPNNYPTHVPFL